MLVTRRRVAAAAFAAIVVTHLVLAAPGRAEGAACTEHRVPVALPGAGRQVLAGTLCLPPGAAPGLVQVLLPGGTYNRTYWDVGYRPDRYSFVQAMHRVGHATFAVDRLGTGTSSRPNGLLLTNEAHAAAVAQLVARLRAGAVAGVGFEHVVLVGHSYGSIVAWYTAATTTVDGVVVTGLLHRMAPPNPARTTPQYPALLDPQFAGAITDPTYLTTVPGTRGAFHARDVEPRLVAQDEATKDTTTVAEVAGIPVALVSGVSGRITAPVLIAVGRDDPLWCAPGASDCANAQAVLAQERGFYASTTCVRAFVLASAGHSLTGARDVAAFFDAVDAWTRAVVLGQPGSRPT